MLYFQLFVFGGNKFITGENMKTVCIPFLPLGLAGTPVSPSSALVCVYELFDYLFAFISFFSLRTNPLKVRHYCNKFYFGACLFKLQRGNSRENRQSFTIFFLKIHVLNLQTLQIYKLTNLATYKLLKLHTFRITNLQTFLQNYRNIKLMNGSTTELQTYNPSNLQNYKLIKLQSNRRGSF